MQTQNYIGLTLKICIAALIFLMANPIQAQTISPRKIDSPWPSWELLDFQPKSPKHNQVYGLDQFRGQVTIVALLATWCPYCQRQIEKLEQLQKELLTDQESQSHGAKGGGTQQEDHHLRPGAVPV